jgi:hypothetical protein
MLGRAILSACALGWVGGALLTQSVVVAASEEPEMRFFLEAPPVITMSEVKLRFVLKNESDHELRPKVGDGMKG